jgi:hypothetical protein
LSPIDNTKSINSNFFSSIIFYLSVLHNTRV